MATPSRLRPKTRKRPRGNRIAPVKPQDKPVEKVPVVVHRPTGRPIAPVQTIDIDRRAQEIFRQTRKISPVLDRRVPIELQPGIVRPGTPYAAKGYWFDANLIRWYDGVLQAVGGIVKTSPLKNVGGPVRGTHGWAVGDIHYTLVTTYNSPYYISANNTVTRREITGTTLPQNATAHYPTEWHIDNYGDRIFIASPVLGRIYTLGTDLVAWTVLANSPVTDRVVITPENFVVALGVSGDNRKIAWADRRNPALWTPAADNTAGDLSIPSKGILVAGRRGQNETLIWTETALFTLRFIGGQFQYGRHRIGGCSILGHRTIVEANNRMFWMGDKAFFMYDGRIRELHCSVSDYVFDDLNSNRHGVIWGYHTPQFSEVTWYYPVGNSGDAECTKYVTYNYKDNLWYFGTLTRSGGYRRIDRDYFVLADNIGDLFFHEHGTNYGTLTPFAETGVIELEQGTRRMYIDEMYPDGNTTGNATISVKYSDGPFDAESSLGPFNTAERVGLGVHARQIRLRIEQENAGWRFGVPRLNIRPSSVR